MRIALVILLFTSFAAYGQRTTSNAGKKQIFLLGTFHFASNNDIVKHKMDDMLSPKRQKEIEELVDRFAEFKPDKVCIEWKAGEDQPFTDSLYNEYLKGNFKLKANEVYQIAFRLAKELGHKKVYCIDAPGDFLYDTLIWVSKKYGQYDWFQKQMDSLYGEARQDDSLQMAHSLKENLLRINSDAAIQFGLAVNSVFTAPLLGEPGEYGGAEFLGEWYKRNIKMYSNILRVTEPRDKRIFVIVGSSHKSIIKHFFETNPGWQMVDVKKYLRP